MQFLSDNTSTACPEILAALAQANHGRVHSYGEDEWTTSLDRLFADYFGTEVRSFAVATGTAANSLSLATLSPPYGAIFAHQEAHIETDECGAPAFFSGGAQLALIAGDHGRITPKSFELALANHPSVNVGVHSTQPAALSLTQMTEMGTVYRAPDIRELCTLAHGRGLPVQMDGARFANAVAFLDCHPGDITWRAGVDVLSFGATKNGALAAEAVVFFNSGLVRDFELRRKRAGHLFSKSRYIAAQLIAYIECGLWLRNAQRTNALAQRIAQVVVRELLHPVEGNEIFLALGVERRARLRAAGFEFYDWGPPHRGEARLVVSWDQPESDVDAVCAALARL